MAIVAFDFKRSQDIMKEIAMNDVSGIKKMDKTSAEMNDGTLYKIFPTHNHVSGYRIDQLIIADDCRWEVYREQWELIDQIKYRMLHSNVPEGFLVQEYEYPILPK